MTGFGADFKRMLSRPGPWMFTFYGFGERSEEHTSELQSRLHLVCRLLLEKKKKNKQLRPPPTSCENSEYSDALLNYSRYAMPDALDERMPRSSFYALWCIAIATSTSVSRTINHISANGYEKRGSTFRDD